MISREINLARDMGWVLCVCMGICWLWGASGMEHPTIFIGACTFGIQRLVVVAMYVCPPTIFTCGALCGFVCAGRVCLFLHACVVLMGGGECVVVVCVVGGRVCVWGMYGGGGGEGKGSG